MGGSDASPGCEQVYSVDTGQSNREARRCEDAYLIIRFDIEFDFLAGERSYSVACVSCISQNHKPHHHSTSHPSSSPTAQAQGTPLT